MQCAADEIQLRLGGVGGAASLPPCPPWQPLLPERSRAEGAAE